MKQTLEVLAGRRRDTGCSRHRRLEKLKSPMTWSRALRQMLYEPSSASLIPVVIHAAAAKQWTPLAESAILARRSLIGGLAQGLYLSVTCAEDLPYIAPGVGEKAAEGTFLRDYRLQQQRRACRLWPRATLENGFHEPVRSAAPVLTMAGQWDPVTPPSQAFKHCDTSQRVPVVVPSWRPVHVPSSLDFRCDLTASQPRSVKASTRLPALIKPPFPTSSRRWRRSISHRRSAIYRGRYADPNRFSADLLSRATR